MSLKTFVFKFKWALQQDNHMMSLDCCYAIYSLVVYVCDASQQLGGKRSSHYSHKEEIPFEFSLLENLIVREFSFQKIKFSRDTTVGLSHLNITSMQSNDLTAHPP